MQLRTLFQSFVKKFVLCKNTGICLNPGASMSKKKTLTGESFDLAEKKMEDWMLNHPKEIIKERTEFLEKLNKSDVVMVKIQLCPSHWFLFFLRILQSN